MDTDVSLKSNDSGNVGPFESETPLTICVSVKCVSAPMMDWWTVGGETRPRPNSCRDWPPQLRPPLRTEGEVTIKKLRNPKHARNTEGILSEHRHVIGKRHKNPVPPESKLSMRLFVCLFCYTFTFYSHGSQNLASNSKSQKCATPQFSLLWNFTSHTPPCKHTHTHTHTLV